MKRLRGVIGHPPGLVIHTDACKGLQIAIDSIFLGVEHRECMKHLSVNFMKKFKGNIFENNLWPASYTYTPRRHATYMQNMYTQHVVIAAASASLCTSTYRAYRVFFVHYVIMTFAISHVFEFLSGYSLFTCQATDN
jgi:hypothetical protein